MTAYIVTPSTSISGSFGIQSTTSRDFILVTEGAYIVVDNLAIEAWGDRANIIIAGHVAAGFGVVVGQGSLEGPKGNNNITLTATATLTSWESLFGALWVRGGDNTINNAGSITAGESEFGGAAGIIAWGTANQIYNSGSITGSATGIQLVADNGLVSGQVTNSGFITGKETGVQIGGSYSGGNWSLGGNYAISNSGEISGGMHAISALGSGNSIANFGLLSTGLGGSSVVYIDSLIGEANVVSNSGTISSLSSSAPAILSNDGNETIENNVGGLIKGDLTLGDGTDRVENDGTIDGNVDTGSSTATGDFVLNTGKILGEVFMSDGEDILWNAGFIGGELHMGGVAFDSVTNLGTIVGGIGFGDGLDELINSGTVGGALFKAGGDGTVTNTGTIAAIFFYDSTVGGNRVTNSGVIRQLVDFSGSTAAGRIDNSGAIGTDVLMGLGNDTLDNDPGGTIGGDVFLEDGADTLENSGRIAGTIYAGDGADSIFNFSDGETGGIELGGGADVVGNSGLIRGGISDTVDGNGAIVTNLASGVIESFVLLNNDGVNTITNVGRIGGSVESSGGSLDNTGTIGGQVTMGSIVNNTINNRAGAEIAGPVVLGDGGDQLTNWGLIEGNINPGGGLDLVTNYGTMLGRIIDAQDGAGGGFWNYGTIALGIQTGTGAATIVNTGTMGYLVGGFSSTTDLTNTGVIDASLLFAGIGGVDNINNTDGEITGSVTLSSGGDTLNNTRGIVRGFVDLGTDNDTLINTNGLIGGTVNAGDGNDLIDSAGGRIDGAVNLGTGDDTFIGGGGNDTVTGGTGNDVVTLGAGDDSFVAGLGASGTTPDGNDDIEAGDGIDTYDASIIGTAMTIDLASGYATGGRIGLDTIAGFENALGGHSGDTITGTEAANLLVGNSGNDSIFGGGGNDTINGGNGSDTIYGGAGQDMLTGGKNLGADVFVYASIADSGTTETTRDTITDFQDGLDKIDLSGIDADANTVGDDAFSFIGAAAFSNTAGELRYQTYAGGVRVTGDVDGNGTADFAIWLRGAHNLTADDFFL